MLFVRIYFYILKIPSYLEKKKNVSVVKAKFFFYLYIYLGFFLTYTLQQSIQILFCLTKQIYSYIKVNR